MNAIGFDSVNNRNSFRHTQAELSYATSLRREANKKRSFLNIHLAFEKREKGATK